MKKLFLILMILTACENVETVQTEPETEIQEQQTETIQPAITQPETENQVEQQDQEIILDNTPEPVYIYVDQIVEVKRMATDKAIFFANKKLYILDKDDNLEYQAECQRYLIDDYGNELIDNKLRITETGQELELDLPEIDKFIVKNNYFYYWKNYIIYRINLENLKTEIYKTFPDYFRLYGFDRTGIYLSLGYMDYQGNLEYDNTTASGWSYDNFYKFYFKMVRLAESTYRRYYKINDDTEEWSTTQKTYCSDGTDQCPFFEFQNVVYSVKGIMLYKNDGSIYIPSLTSTNKKSPFEIYMPGREKRYIMLYPIGEYNDKYYLMNHYTGNLMEFDGVNLIEKNIPLLPAGLNDRQKRDDLFDKSGFSVIENCIYYNNFYTGQLVKFNLDTLESNDLMTVESEKFKIKPL